MLNMKDAGVYQTTLKDIKKMSNKQEQEIYKLNEDGSAVIINDSTRPEFELKYGDRIFLRNLLWRDGNSDYEATVGEDLEDFILAMNTDYKNYEVSKLYADTEGEKKNGK